jgi:hypothetical protein
MRNIFISHNITLYKDKIKLGEIFMADLSQNKLQELLKLASKKLGTSPEELQRKLEKNPSDLLKNLNPQQMSKVKQLLKDPEKAKQMAAQSPQLKQMLDKALENKNG